MVEIRPDRRTLIETAINQARAGAPRLLCINGASGMGKTTHLRAAIDAAVGFRVLEASCDEVAYRPAYGLFERLGVPPPVTDRGTPQEPAVAAQSLRRVIEAEADGPPLIIAVDDAQWADSESLEALRLVLERAAGDRLLVMVANRAVPGREHTPWPQHNLDPEAVTVLTLDGIGLVEAGEVIRGAVGWNRCPDDLVERLWLHTDRNPMHLASLVRQYSADELIQRTALPAPQDVARDLSVRLAAMDIEAARLLRAVAVTGAMWIDRLEAVAVAQIDDPSAAFAFLNDAGLLVVRSDAPLADVRIVHALVRAAVYQSTPAAERRAMHERASHVALSTMHRLEHAVAAASRRDEPLALRLEEAALAAHLEPDYRREAQLWQWASQLSASVAGRERRWLESQLATVLARDTRAVRAHLQEFAGVGDEARREVLMAWLLVVEHRIADARRTLESLSSDALGKADYVVRRRWRVLTAWTMLASGYPAESIQALLDQLPVVTELDPAERPFYVRAAGEIARGRMDAEHWRRDLNTVPIDARATPMEETDNLSWRGAVYALSGQASEARRDLSEVASRIRGGRVDTLNGVPHALHSFSLWLDGEFDRALIEQQAATELSPGALHPLVQAMLPLIPTVRGDFTRADALLDESRAVLVDLPWHVPVSVLVVATVARLHAGDDDAARAACLPRLRAHFGGELTAPNYGSGALWQLHLALARIWAGELDAVEGHLKAIETDLVAPAWSSWCRPWLSGLRSERAGRFRDAHRLLKESIAAFTGDLPLYRGHVQADLARVSALAGDSECAARSSEEATRIYSGLGATAYLNRLPVAATVDPLATLSDREREVAALLLSGFSYAQIAQELYVTRSTVAFHLSRIYAKAGVESRHQFTQQVRLARSGGR